MRLSLASVLAAATALALAGSAAAQQGTGQRPFGKEGTPAPTAEPNKTQPPNTAPGAPPSATQGDQTGQPQNGTRPMRGSTKTQPRGAQTTQPK